MPREKLLVHRDGKKFIYIATLAQLFLQKLFAVCIKSRSDCRVNNDRLSLTVNATSQSYINNICFRNDIPIYFNVQLFVKKRTIINNSMIYGGHLC